MRQIARLKAEVPVCGMETLRGRNWLPSFIMAKGRGSRLRDGNSTENVRHIAVYVRLKAEVPVCGMETVLRFQQVYAIVLAKGRGSRLRDGNE